MGGSTLIPLKRVWDMLTVCAPGWMKRQTAHHHRISLPDGRIYPSLPLGDHGHRREAQVQAGHIRNMVRQLGIEECARCELPDAFG